MSDYFSVRMANGVVTMIDQRLLPAETVYLDFADPRLLADAIRDMVVRGAPAIGAAAGFGLALAAHHSSAQTPAELWADLQAAAEVLRAARPTAVNLFWAVGRVLERVEAAQPATVEAMRTLVQAEANAICDEDAAQNVQIGIHGQAVVPDPANIIHHCNTGALATAGYGTALGVIRRAHEEGKRVHVYVDETRPRLQGARLTTWELQQLGVPHTLIVDGAAAHFMRQGKVDLCLVGCDRVAANGDTANKIGTYHLACAAAAHNIPLYVVGPTSTVDLNIASGAEIPIEERGGEEVIRVGDCAITPEGVRAANPAFDVTPAAFIRGIITEKGIATPPYTESLRRLVLGEAA
ncbi:MAG: S-methyl-5-thioribose-1-phosphate isomerase [Anaerolineales bacterium]|nr:S-methyl-5-thioribose-1-phosphate isomerase [Anaerolineales bacterium]